MEDLGGRREGWRNFADQAVYAGKDIRDQGSDKLDEHWQDKVGEAAGKVLSGLATAYDCASDLMGSVAMILEGLAEAVEVAEKLRASAKDYEDVERRITEALEDIHWESE